MAHASRDERKARLAEATWQVILDRGVGAVSVRSVAAQAQMAVGSLRHLFPTQAELLQFSAELVVARATARVSATVPGPSVVDHALEVIGHLMPLTRETRREFEVNVALIAETPAHPGLARIRDNAHLALLDLFVRLVATVREQDADAECRREARRLLALVDGVGLHLLHQPPDADTVWAIDMVRAELEQLASERSGG